ncbi:MAG: sulfurtransferase [Gammaproteobacteria bacterium]|nr:MAG: sulfurtransferase [Gammaproteobacteria bacterium]
MPLPLLTPLQLQQSLAENTVVFDCRFSLADFSVGREQYLQGHIPGAYHLDMERDLSGPKGKHGGRHPLPSPEQFDAKMRACGVDSETRVVAYDDNRMAGAARLWWLLRYFGHERVQVLDGGLKGWLAAGGELGTEIPPEKQGFFQAKPDPSMVLALQDLQKADAQPVTLIDAREAPRYRGEQEPIDPVAGHIPGALNLPWIQLTDTEGRFISTEQQHACWQALGKLEKPVVYCGSGVTACVDLLSLALLGRDDAQLYSGSWSDWCSYPDNPIATGDTP